MGVITDSCASEQEKSPARFDDVCGIRRRLICLNARLISEIVLPFPPGRAGKPRLCRCMRGTGLPPRMPAMQEDARLNSELPGRSLDRIAPEIAEEQEGLPVVFPPPPERPKPRRRLRLLLALIVLIAAGTGAGWWWTHRPPPLPPWIASSNGRLEADEVDIDTKYAGRILKLYVDEGDFVKQGQVVAVMDTRDLEQQKLQYEHVMRQ